MSFTLITVTHTFKNLDGSTPAGTVAFRLSKRITNGADSYTAGIPIESTIDSSGNLSVTLPANNDPATLPADSTYIVSFFLDGESGQELSGDEYEIVVPHDAAGGTVDLGTLLPNQVGPNVDGTSSTLGSETWPVWLDRDQQVKPWLQWWGIDSSHDEVLDIVIAGVCARAAKLRGGPIAETLFGPADGLGKFDGSGGMNSGYIMLPRTPVIQVVSVVEYQGNAPVTLTEITDPAGSGTSGATDGFQVNYRTGRLTRVLGGIWNRPFYPGSNNVWVTWKAGYNPIPGDWIEAALEWTAFVYRNLQEVVTSNRTVSAGMEYDPADTVDVFYRGVPNRITSVFSTNSKVGIR